MLTLDKKLSPIIHYDNVSVVITLQGRSTLSVAVSSTCAGYIVMIMNAPWLYRCTAKKMCEWQQILSSWESVSRAETTGSTVAV